MSKQVINTSKSMSKPSVNEKELENQIKKAAEAFEKEKLVQVSINTNLQKNIGESLPLGINGVRIVLPVDGSKHKIPESFANLLNDYLANLKT